MTLKRQLKKKRMHNKKVCSIILCSQSIHCSNVLSIETISSVFCEKYAILHFLLRCRTSNSDCFRVSLHNFYSMARVDTVEEHFFGTRHAISNSCAEMSSSYYFAAFIGYGFPPLLCLAIQKWGNDAISKPIALERISVGPCHQPLLHWVWPCLPAPS